MTSSTRLPPLVRTVDIRKQTMIILTACAALTLYIGFLIASNYRSQQALQASALCGFRLDLEKRAVSLGYFFSEREYDLRSMAGSRELNAYFGNKALGMSEEYGLKLNLFVVAQLFQKTLREKAIQGDPIYERFVLRDKSGKVLVDSLSGATGAAVAAKGGPDGPETRDPGRALVSDETPEDRKSCFSISSPIDYKGIEVGELEARINPWTPWVHFVENQSFLSDKGFELMSCDHRAVGAAVSKRPSPLRLLNDELLAKVSNEKFVRLPAEDAGQYLLFTRVQVEKMPLYLLAWVKEEEYWKNPILWHLLFGTGSLAVVILAGIGLLMRFDNQNRALERQFAESERQQNLLFLRNRQLKEEIKKRREAESKLEKQRTLRMRSDRLRSLGEMAAGIAHELNQPLVGVRGMAELSLLCMDQGTEATVDLIRGHIERIVEQADRMVHIINHVRMFAREAGNVQTSVVDINDVVRSGIGLLSAQFKSRGLRLAQRLSFRPLRARVNPYSVEEVLLNLMNNARHAVESKKEVCRDPGFSPCVEVETGLEDRDGDRIVRMSVKDNGTGIDPSIADKIFDPFYTTKDPDKGTGLGLSICKSIVEEFGGTIGFDSGNGDGAVFTVEFPESRADQSKGEQSQAKEE